MKKKIFLFASLLVILAILAGGTYAVLSYTETANNRITFGSVKIQLVSELKAKQSENGEFVSKIEGVVPGDTFDDKVTVKNVSSEQAVWVRLRLGPVWYGVDPAPSVESAYGSLEDFESAIFPAEYNFNVGDGADQWSFSDGWIYYNSPLEAGEEAAPLFTTVSFSGPGMDNRYQNSSFEITFSAQAVQFVNNADQPGETWQDAAGWPESDNN